MRRTPERWAAAIAHLKATDPRWVALIDRIGPCELRPRRDRFGALVRAIIGQQISTKAAATIAGRLYALAGTPPDPHRVLALGEPSLRLVGLSAMKAKYVLNLAAAVSSGELPLHRLGLYSDQSIRDRLTAVKGIGTWTAEMFLIFALNRADVLPLSDLGVRAGLRRFHGLEDVPTPQECISLAEPWRPYRSIAMWYLWRHIDSPKPGG
ncbi:MAG TPA: DNA-3-methyladenine glycosylase [Isosphaeraceae bacterium]|jgi:DNA-3-methyladenine glycosylase II|nr:DNA-3-methyladenine glycosylase [Isosphaeraceae bacterium]